MSAIIRLSPHAFVVWWKDVERWSVGSFVETDWRWPANVIRPLSAALTRKLVELERDGNDPGALQLVTLHFDGPLPRISSGCRRPLQECLSHRLDKAGNATYA